MSFSAPTRCRSWTSIETIGDSSALARTRRFPGRKAGPKRHPARCWPPVSVSSGRDPGIARIRRTGRRGRFTSGNNQPIVPDFKISRFQKMFTISVAHNDPMPRWAAARKARRRRATRRLCASDRPERPPARRRFRCRCGALSADSEPVVDARDRPGEPNGGGVLPQSRSAIVSQPCVRRDLGSTPFTLEQLAEWRARSV